MFLNAVFLFLTSIMMVYLIRHYIFTITVLRRAKSRGRNESHLLMNSNYEPNVSVLIPARNEEKVIGRLLGSLVELTYPKQKFEVIVVDDASTDDTGKIVDGFVARFSFIKVIHRSPEQGGKGKTLIMNSAFHLSNGDVILCFDADYCPQKDIVEKLVMEFLDPKVGAVQGRVVVLNEPTNMVTRLVALERIGGYRIDQEARDNLSLIPQFGGTVGGFRRSVLEELGGWDERVLAEDTDLTFRVYLAGYKVRYVCVAECYEEAVDSWRAYWTQRYRWARGHMQCCFRHWWKVLKSKKLSLREKFDGLLLLNIYFMPLIVLLSIIIGVVLIFSKTSVLANILWFSVPVSLYSFVGNFAPFFEVGVGAYLDGRRRTQLLIPLLIFAFVYNMPICIKAFFDLMSAKILRQNPNPWAKTEHLGGGYSYLIANETLIHLRGGE